MSMIKIAATDVSTQLVETINGVKERATSSVGNSLRYAPVPFGDYQCVVTDAEVISEPTSTGKNRMKLRVAFSFEHEGIEREMTSWLMLGFADKDGALVAAEGKSPIWNEAARFLTAVGALSEKGINLDAKLLKGTVVTITISTVFGLKCDNKAALRPYWDQVRTPASCRKLMGLSNTAGVDEMKEAADRLAETIGNDARVYVNNYPLFFKITPEAFVADNGLRYVDKTAHKAATQPSSKLRY